MRTIGIPNLEMVRVVTQTLTTVTIQAVITVAVMITVQQAVMTVQVKWVKVYHQTVRMVLLSLSGKAEVRFQKNTANRLLYRNLMKAGSHDPIQMAVTRSFQYGEGSVQSLHGVI